MKKQNLFITICLLVCTLVLASCQQVPTLESPSVTLEDNIVLWTAVENADSYNVYVNNQMVINVKTTSYTIADTEPGSYKVEVSAVAKTNSYANSLKSNSVTYVVEPKTLDNPVITLEGNIVSWSAVSNAESYDVYVNGNKKANITTTSFELDYNLVGEYRVEVIAISSSSSFVSSSYSNMVTYTIEPVELVAPVITLTDKVVTWEAVDNAHSYDVYVDDQFVCNTTELSYTFDQVVDGLYTCKVVAKAPSSQFVDSIKSNSVQYELFTLDLTKPIVMINGGSTGNVLEVLPSTNPLLENYFAVGSLYDGSNTLQALKLIETTFTYTNESENGVNKWINESDGKFYFIKTVSGKYLTGVDGATVNENGKWYVSEDILDKENLMYMWQLIEGATKGTYLLRNVGTSLVLGRAYQNSYYSSVDADNHVHFYNLIDNHPAFMFTFKNVEGATFAPDQVVELDGMEVNIYDDINNSYYTYDASFTTEVSGDPNVANIKKAETFDGVAKSLPGYVFTFTKVLESEFVAAGLDPIPNAYRITNTEGKYLSYAGYGNLEGRDITSDLTSAWGLCQVFIVNKRAGMVNSYHISNMHLGKWIDNIDGQTKYIIFNSTQGQGIYNRQNIIEWNYIKDATWHFQEAETPEVGFSLDKPVIVEVSDHLGTALGMVTSTNPLVGSYLAPSRSFTQGSIATVSDLAMLFIETTFNYTNESENGVNNWVKPSDGKFYYIKLANGKYLAETDGALVGENGRWFTTEGVLDKEDLMYMWQVVETANENEVLLRNVGASILLGRAYSIEAYSCSDADAHIHQYGLIQSHPAFIFKLTNVDATIAPDALVDLDNKDVNIANLFTNSYYKYDATFTPEVTGSASVANIMKGATYNGLSITDAGYVFTFEKVADSEFTNAGLAVVPNCFRIKNSDGKYLSFADHGNLEGRDLTADLTSPWGICQVFVIKDVPGIVNGYRIGNLFLNKWTDPIDGQNKYICFQSHDSIANGIWNRQNNLEWNYHTNIDWFIEVVE